MEGLNTMTSADFMRELRSSLEGEVSASVVSDTVNYYDSYIRNEINSGKTEEEIIEELGPARLIAKSIIDAQDGAARKQEARVEEERKREEREERERSRHLHADINDKGEFDLKYGNFSLNSWYGKLLLVLAAVLVVIVVILAIVAIVMLAWYLLPVIAVIVIVIVLLIIFMNIGRRK